MPHGVERIIGRAASPRAIVHDAIKHPAVRFHASVHARKVVVKDNAVDRTAGSHIGLLGGHVTRTPVRHQRIAIMVDLSARLDGRAECKGGD